MSLYSLHTALEHASTKQGRVSTLTAISLRQNGEYVTGSATAHLLSTSAVEHAVVFIPADAQLINAPERHADFTGDTGIRYYDFASHEAALAFLRSLYGIAQTETRKTTSTRPAVSVFPRSVPAPLARDVDLSCPASLHGMTDRASFLAHIATYQQPLTARNTQ